MTNSFINFAFGICAMSALAVTACSQRKSETSKVLSDNVVMVADCVIGQSSSRIVEDTIVGKWWLKTTKRDNEIVLKNDYYAVRDSSVFITLSYDNKPVFIEKEIRTMDLMGNEGEYLMYWGGDLYWYSDSTIYLSFGCFLPETDDGWSLLYQIHKNGTTNLIVEDFELGVDGYDVVSSFLTLYFSERGAGIPITGMKPLLEKYCVDSVAAGLINGELMIDTSDTDFKEAQRTLSIEKIWDDSTDTGLYFNFNVEWKPVPNDDSIMDGGIFVVGDLENKISKIEYRYRKMI